MKTYPGADGGSLVEQLPRYQCTWRQIIRFGLEGEPPGVAACIRCHPEHSGKRNVVERFILERKSLETCR